MMIVDEEGESQELPVPEEAGAVGGIKRNWAVKEGGHRAEVYQRQSSKPYYLES